MLLANIQRLEWCLRWVFPALTSRDVSGTYLVRENARNVRLRLRVLFFALITAPLPAAGHANGARSFLDKFCITCHNEKLRSLGLAVDVPDV